MNAILFKKDGTFESIPDIQPSTYLDIPVYVRPTALMRWTSDGTFPSGVTTIIDRRRYLKQLESDDFAVFTEE